MLSIFAPMGDIQITYWAEKVIEWAMNFGPKVIGAILIWLIGNWLIRKLMKVTRLIMERREYDLSLRKFLLSLIRWSLIILLFLAILGTLGVETTSFAAIIASAGLALGLALQGSLANFAGGALIMIFKPFKVGDFIEAQGMSGTVKEINIFTTKLNRFGNELVLIPNGKLSNENIVNFSAEENRRNNIIIGIDYTSSIKKAKEVLTAITANNPKILKEPQSEVVVDALADSSVNLSLRFWSKNEDYWTTRFETIEAIKVRFDEEGIEIPFPHQVHVDKKSNKNK